VRKTLVIAVREYSAAVRTKTFIISLVIMPVMGSAGLIAALALRGQVNIDDKRFAVLDHTGKLYQPLAVLVDQRNRDVAIESSRSDPTSTKPAKPRFVLEAVKLGETPIDEVRADLSERVRAGDLTGFIEISAGVLDGRAAQDAAVSYRTNNPMYYEFQSFLADAINDVVRQWRCDQAGLDCAQVAWATKSVTVTSDPLYTRTAAGAVTTTGQNARYVQIAAGVTMALLLFMVILVAAMPLTYSVLEEKIQRSAEMLLGTVTPFQFMMGKLLGMVGVSLTIVTIYLFVGFCVASYTGYAHSLPRHLVIWFVLYQAGAILMFGSIYIAIGAACNDMKDAQNLMTPASLVACVPLFLLRPVMLEPNSAFSTLASFVPPATPVLMLLRQGLPGRVPIWQPVAGLVLVVVTSVGCVWIAGRIFRVGILMQGKGASVRQMLQWALRPRTSRAPQSTRRRDDRPIATSWHDANPDPV